jgi:hypothetical protein
MRISLVLVLGFVSIGYSGCKGHKEVFDLEKDAKVEGLAPVDTQEIPDFDRIWGDKVKAVIAGLSTEIDCHFPVDDKQLEDLPEDVHLEVLLLEQGGLSRTGIERVARLLSLRRLVLRDCSFGDEEASLVAAMPNLAVLNIPNSQLTGIGLVELSHSKSLISLRVGTDRPIENLGSSLQGFQELRHLHLIGFNVDQAALKVLVELPELQSIYLDDAQLSDNEIDWLVEAGDHLHIHLDQIHPDRKDPPESGAH